MMESCLLVAVYPCFFVSPRRWDAVHGEFFFWLEGVLLRQCRERGHVPPCTRKADVGRVNRGTRFYLPGSPRLAAGCVVTGRGGSRGSQRGGPRYAFSFQPQRGFFCAHLCSHPPGPISLAGPLCRVSPASVCGFGRGTLSYVCTRLAAV